MLFDIGTISYILKVFINCSSPPKPKNEPGPVWWGMLAMQWGFPLFWIPPAPHLLFFPSMTSAQDTSKDTLTLAWWKDTEAKLPPRWGLGAHFLTDTRLWASSQPASKGHECIFYKKLHCSAQVMGQGWP